MARMDFERSALDRFKKTRQLNVMLPQFPEVYQAGSLLRVKLVLGEMGRDQREGMEFAFPLDAFDYRIYEWSVENLEYAALKWLVSPKQRANKTLNDQVIGTLSKMLYPLFVRVFYPDFQG